MSQAEDRLRENLKPEDRVRTLHPECVRTGTSGISRYLKAGSIVTAIELTENTVRYKTEEGHTGRCLTDQVELVRTPDVTTVEDTPSRRDIDTSDKVFLYLSFVVILAIPCVILNEPIKEALTTLTQKGHAMTDALMNLTNEPLVHDAIIRLVAGGGYLALGTLAILFLRNVAVNLGKYGDRRRRLRLEDEARTMERQEKVSKMEANDHARFVETEARKKEAEASYIAQIVRASLSTQPPNAIQATPQSTSPTKIEPGMWVKFITDAGSKIRALGDEGYQSRSAKIGDCVRVQSMENGGETIVYDPGQGENLQRVHISRVAPV